MRPPYTLLLLAVVLLAACRREVTNNSALGPVSTPHQDNVPEGLRIERAQEIEEAFAAVDQSAWVFKHSGGRLTARLEIYLRTAGKDAAEDLVFQANADSLDASLRQGESDRADSIDKGFLIVTVPNSFANLEGEVVFACTKAGAFTRTTETSRRILPAALPEGAVSGGGFAIEKPASLKPGESLVLAERTKHFHGGDAEHRSLDECDRIRLVLSVTALPGGTPAAGGRQP